MDHTRSSLRTRIKLAESFAFGWDSVAIIAFSAFAGGMASILIRLDQFEAQRAVDPKLLFLNAAFKPYLGALISFFVLSLQGRGIVTVVGIEHKAPDFAEKITYCLVVVGFLSGFSERFASDFIGTAEGKFGGARASPSKSTS